MGMCILWYLFVIFLFLLNIIVVLWYKLELCFLNKEVINIILCFLVSLLKKLVVGLGIGLVKLNVLVFFCW